MAKYNSPAKGIVTKKTKRMMKITVPKNRVAKITKLNVKTKTPKKNEKAKVTKQNEKAKIPKQNVKSKKENVKKVKNKSDIKTASKVGLKMTKNEFVDNRERERETDRKRDIY